MGLQRLLFGTFFRIVATVAISLVVLLGGAFAAGIIGVPSLEAVDNEFGEVDEKQTEILTTLTVSNPNPIGVASADIDAAFVVHMNDVEMAAGTARGIALEPGTSSEQVTTQLQNDRIPEWWVTHIQNDEETEVVIDATISSGALDRSTGITDERTIDTDLLSEFDSDEARPIDADRPLVDDPFLYINSTRASWGDVDHQYTELDLRFDMYNPQAYPVPMTKLGYEITMNDVVVGEGESDREHILVSGQETPVQTTTRITNDNLDEWWVTHIENDEVSELRIEFDAQFELATGTTISVPLDALTYEETIETDIWGNKNASSEDTDTKTETETETDTSADDSSESDGTNSDARDDDDGLLPIDTPL